jgi:four helix bundle protein
VLGVRSETQKQNTFKQPSTASRKHHNLLVWQEAMKLVKMIYSATAKFPQSELYGLASQMRRAAVSIPSNVAEGAGRSGQKEFLQFLSISRGSLCELETQCILASDLGFITDVSEILIHIEKLFGLLGGLINSLRKRNEI